MADWYAAGDADALARVRAAWPAAPVANPELLGFILDVAKEQVVEYAPKENPFDQVRILLFGLGAAADVIETVVDSLRGSLVIDGGTPTEVGPVLSGGTPSESGTVFTGGNPRTFYVEPQFTTPPVRFVLAQLQQARNLWDAGTANQDGGIGPDEFRFVPRPLDKTIRSLIRPVSGGADVF